MGFFDDIGTFFNRATDEGQIFSNPAVDAGIAASILLPFLAPSILPALGAGAAADIGAGAPLDLLAGGAAAGTAVPAEVGSLVAPTGALASGLATEPGFASSALGTFAPGLNTTAAGLGGVGAAAPSGVGALAPFSGSSPTAPGAGGALSFAPTNTALIPNDPIDIVPGGGGPATGSADFPTLGPGISTAGLNTSTGSDLLGGASNLFKNNAGLLSLLGLGVGGQLASPAISKALGLNKVPGSENLNRLAQRESALAGQQQAFGTAAEQPLLTGVLPLGQQQAVTNALNDAIQTIKGRYASLGLSGSTMEAQAIADAQNRSVEVAGQLEQQMAQTGAQAVSQATSALGLEEGIYNTILNATIQQDDQLGNAISNFASSAALGTAIGQARRA